MSIPINERLTECIEMLELIKESIGDKTGNDVDTIIYGIRMPSVNFVLNESIQLLTLVANLGGKNND